MLTKLNGINKKMNWKLASYENLSYIDGLEYGEDTTEYDTQDSRKLVMFMRVTEEQTPASPDFNSNNIEKGYSFLQDSPLYHMNTG